MSLNLTAAEIAEINTFLDDGDELSDQLYQKLYEHYLNNGEMPYGVAKARTGDPFQWIGDRLPGLVGRNS